MFNVAIKSEYVTVMFSALGMKMIAHMGEVVQDNYPEVVKRSFLINGRTYSVLACV